jgi:CRP-like cAMP-binding protein
MIDGLPRSASVIALTNCELRFLSKVAFDQITRDHPEIHQYLTKVLATRLRHADETIASLAFLPLKGRIARALLTLAERLGAKTESGGMIISRMITQGDIAAMAGVSRETTNRILSEWERIQLVAKSVDSYHINDPAKLKREIDG